MDNKDSKTKRQEIRDIFGLYGETLIPISLMHLVAIYLRSF